MTIKQSPPKEAAEKGFPNLANGLAEASPIEPLSLEEARSLRGIGWQGNLDEMCFSRVL